MVRVVKCNMCGEEIAKPDEDKWDAYISQYHTEKEKTHTVRFSFDLCTRCKENILKALKIPADKGDC